MRKIAVLFLVIALLAGCTRQLPAEQLPKPQHSTIPQETLSQPTTPQASAQAPQVDVLGLFSDRDYRTGYESYATITLNGATATTNSNAVQLEKGILKITDEGTYVLTGSFTGMVLVDADKKDKIQLVFQGVDVENPTGAALYIRQADKVFLTLEGESSLTAGETFAQIDDNNIDGAVFSKDDLTINGAGSLRVRSPGGHGIVCKDSLHITGGSCYVESAEHGITANDEICIDARGLELYAGKDGLHCEHNEDATLGYIYVRNGRLLITSEGDGISAGAWFYAHGGEYKILAGGGSKNGSKQSSDNWGGFGGGFGGGGKRPGKPGMSQQPVASTKAETDSTSIKGIKAGTWLTVAGGVFTIDSADDGLHSNGGMDITSGWVNLLSGDDGIHAEQTLTVSGGTILVKESYEGMEALHVQIYAGDITLTASDDGINAAGGTDQSGLGGRDQWGGGKGGFGGFGGNSNGSILIAGGTLQITASGDALDANGALEITGGQTVLCGPTRGDTAVLDYDRTGIISGGMIIGTGSTMMAQTLSGTNQGVISLRASGAAKTPIRFADSKGNVILEHTPALEFGLIIFSSPDLVKGEAYSVTIGTSTQTVTAK